MELEQVPSCKVVDPCSPFDTIVPKGQGTVGVSHVLANSLLDQTDTELSFIRPRGPFFKDSQRGTDLITECLLTLGFLLSNQCIGGSNLLCPACLTACDTSDLDFKGTT